MLVDQIYRKRDTITFCSGLGIRLSGKKLGRPKKDADMKEERKTVYQNNTDRIEVKRKFSLAKRKFGLGLLLTKREDTTKASIFLSIIAMNIDRFASMLLRLLRFILSFFVFDDEKVKFSEIAVIEERLNNKSGSLM